MNFRVARYSPEPFGKHSWNYLHALIMVNIGQLLKVSLNQPWPAEDGTPRRCEWI